LPLQGRYFFANGTGGEPLDEPTFDAAGFKQIDAGAVEENEIGAGVGIDEDGDAEGAVVVVAGPDLASGQDRDGGTRVEGGGVADVDERLEAEAVALSRPIKEIVFFRALLDAAIVPEAVVERGERGFDVRRGFEEGAEGGADVQFLGLVVVLGEGVIALLEVLGRCAGECYVRGPPPLPRRPAGSNPVGTATGRCSRC